MINFTQEDSKPFTLVMQIRDMQGRSTGKTKIFSSDYGSKLAEFWNKNCYRAPRKKDKDNLPNSSEAQQILEIINSDQLL